MPKNKKTKATPPHRMALRSRRSTQQITSASQSQVAVTGPNLNNTGSTNNLPLSHANHPVSTSVNQSDNRFSPALSTSQPTFAENLPDGPDDEYPATQIIASEHRFTRSTIQELGNVTSASADREEPPTQIIDSRVSLLRRELAELSNLYPSSDIDEEPLTQVVDSSAQFSESMKAEINNVHTPSAIHEPETQVVTSARFSNIEVERLANVDTAAATAEESNTQVVASAAPFSERMLGYLANIEPAVVVCEEPSTQVVASVASFSEEVLRQLANISPAASNDEEKTQVVLSGLPFSERMIGELGNVDLANISISPTAIVDDDDYDEEPTIRYLSDQTGSNTISDGDTIPDGIPTPSRGPVAVQSQHSSNRSWATGSLTSSMRVAIGLHPKPLSKGRIRPVPEDLGSPPARYPCIVTITHHTCGHSYKNVKHHDRCIHDDGPSERVVREATPEPPVLDEWGLPPSAQRPGRMPCLERETMLLGGTKCEGCMTER